jgi:hypothetical protein
LILIIPNIDLIQTDITVLKQDIQAPTATAEADPAEGQVLPSFLESSSGVNETPELGLVGSGDPTIPLAFTESFVETALANDERVYGQSLSTEARDALVASMIGNESLDNAITDNATTGTTTQNVSIKLVNSLTEFINFK